MEIVILILSIVAIVVGIIVCILSIRLKSWKSAIVHGIATVIFAIIFIPFDLLMLK